MAEQTERAYSFLYFNKSKNAKGDIITGKYDHLKVRFLYQGADGIQRGRVHTHFYRQGKAPVRVLCLKDGIYPDEKMAKVDCPLCKIEKFGTPGNKYFAWVEDLNDDNKLKLLMDIPYQVIKTLNTIVDMKAVPLHDLTFTIIKDGVGKGMTYTPMFEEKSKFNVADFFQAVGLSDYPKLSGPDHTPILSITHAQMLDMVDNGKMPWSTNSEGETTTRKYTGMGANITVYGNEDTPNLATAEGVDDITDDMNMEDPTEEPTPTPAAKPAPAATQAEAPTPAKTDRTRFF